MWRQWQLPTLHRLQTHVPRTSSSPTRLLRWWTALCPRRKWTMLVRWLNKWLAWWPKLPPIYGEQGQPRGRKPKKGSKLEKVKKHAMKSKKSKKSKGKGKKSKKSPTVASTVMDGNDDVLMEVPVASKTKKRVSGKKKSTHETGASASEPAACPKPKAARRKRRASKAVSDPPAAPNGPSEVDRIDLECPPGGHVEPKVDKGGWAWFGWTWGWWEAFATWWCYWCPKSFDPECSLFVGVPQSQSSHGVRRCCQGCSLMLRSTIVYWMVGQ